MATCKMGKFEDSLFKFSKEIWTSTSKGREKSNAIPMQSTSISSRTNKVRVVMEVREEDEIVNIHFHHRKKLKWKIRTAYLLQFPVIGELKKHIKLFVHSFSFLCIN